MNAPRHRRPLGWTYAAVTALSLYLTFMLWIVGDVIRTDFLATSPDDSFVDALFMVLFGGPILSGGLVVAMGTPYIVTSVIIAKIAARLFGTVPLWTLPINALAGCVASCVFTFLWEPLILCVDQPDYDSGTGAPDGSFPFFLVWVFLYVLSTLMIAWWLTRPVKTDNAEQNLSLQSKTS